MNKKLQNRLSLQLDNELLQKIDQLDISTYKTRNKKIVFILNAALDLIIPFLIATKNSNLKEKEEVN